MKHIGSGLRDMALSHLIVIINIINGKNKCRNEMKLGWIKLF